AAVLADARRSQRFHRASRRAARGRGMSALVQLPSALREYTAGAAHMETNASDVHGALSQLAATHPPLRRHLYTDNGELRGYVRIYLNEEDVSRLAEGTRTPLSSGDVILIVPSIAGGESAALNSDNAAPFSRDETSRYARHMALEEVGPEGQQKLRAAKVAV